MSLCQADWPTYLNEARAREMNKMQYEKNENDMKLEIGSTVLHVLNMTNVIISLIYFEWFNFCKNPELRNNDLNRSLAKNCVF